MPMMETYATMDEPVLAKKQNSRYVKLISAGTLLTGALAALDLAWFGVGDRIFELSMPVLAIAYNLGMMFAESRLL